MPRKSLLKMAGQDFDALEEARGDARLQAGAARRHGVDDAAQQLRTIDSQNVIAKLEGSDPS